MARLHRICLPGVPQHVIQRGNNRAVCFGGEEDFAAYAYWLDEYSREYEVAIHAWVFMTNHVHLLLTPAPEEDDSVSTLMRSLGRRYVRYFNYSYKRTGTLWEGRCKACLVDADAYLLVCQRYIELNPVRAGMVEVPEAYPWSRLPCQRTWPASEVVDAAQDLSRTGKDAGRKGRSVSCTFRRPHRRGSVVSDSKRCKSRDGTGHRSLQGANRKLGRPATASIEEGTKAARE